MVVERSDFALRDTIDCLETRVILKGTASNPGASLVGYGRIGLQTLDMTRRACFMCSFELSVRDQGL